MYDRLLKLISQEDLNKLHNSKIAVVGVGGVGAYAAEALIRSGIQNLLIIDFDKVDISNKNRQLIALDSTIGKDKVDILKSRLEDINKEALIETKKIFLDESNIGELINWEPDYVVDACDSINTKKTIIKFCQNKKINLVSSMGVGNRLDPSKLKITSLDKTSGDPLAKLIRKWIKDEKLNYPMVLASDEPPIKTGEREPGSTAFVPPSAGLMIASHVFCDIIKKEL